MKHKRDMSMFNERVDEASKELGFLFNRVPISRNKLAAWLASPEFVEEMLRIKSTGRFITNEDVLNTMEEVYDWYQFEIKEKGILRPGIRYAALRSGKNELRKVLYPDSIQERSF